MRISKKKKTTENVARAKKRKEERWMQRRELEIKKAEELGITVDELRQREFNKVQGIIKDNASKYLPWRRDRFY